MYFNHAFKKSFLLGPNGITATALTLPAPGSATSALTPGQIGLFNAKTFESFTTAPASNVPFLLVQGSYFTNDKIGPSHGGYTESVKSKVVNPKYINRVFTTCANEPQQHIKEVCVCSMECGNTYNLRIDLKGSPALRFLSHNIYKTVSAFTGCCTDDCTATCTGAIVDPTIVTINWAKSIALDPILHNFLQLEVRDWDGELVADQADFSTVEEFIAELDTYSSAGSGWDAYLISNPIGAALSQSCLRFTGAYEDTKFGNCTFRVTDHYELQPINILLSLTDDSGETCNLRCVTITGQYNFTTSNPGGVYTPEIQVPLQAQGVGQTVIRDMILSNRYRQEAFPDGNFTDSLRMREIEVPSALRNFDTDALYNSVNILHSVPRFNNPSGTFDNDQYLLTIWAEVGVNTTTLVSLLQDILDGAGNGVEVEYLTATGDPCVDFTTTTTTAAPTTTTTTAP